MNVEDFYPLIASELPDCPDETMRQKVIQTLQEFCRQTHAWKELQEQIPIIDGINEYEFDVPQHALPLAIKGVWVNGMELHPKTMGALALAMPDWQDAESNMPALYNAPDEWGLIKVYPRPRNSNGARMSIRAALAPKLSATTIPDSIAERYSEALEAGSKWRLMVMPNQKWSNPETGDYYSGIYRNEIDKARIEQLHEKVQGTMTVRPVRFG